MSWWFLLSVYWMFNFYFIMRWYELEISRGNKEHVDWMVFILLFFFAGFFPLLFIVIVIVKVCALNNGKEK